MGVGLYNIPMLGGVNLFTHPTALGEGEIVRSKNMAPVNHKRMSKRLGVGYLGGANLVSDYPIAGTISPFVPNVVPYDVIALARPASGAENLFVYALQDGQTTSIALDSGIFYTQRPWVYGLGNAIYILAGYDAIPIAPATPPAFWKISVSSGGIVPSYDGFSGTGNEIVRPKVASPYKRRVVYANFGPGYENTIVFSDNGLPYLVGDSVLAVNARAINLTVAQDGDEIVALVEVMLFNVGSPATSALLVLRRFGNPFLITGEPDQTTGGTSTLDIKRISVNAGCANPYTVARTPYGIIWAGQDDVWCFDYGTVRNIGLKIQPALRVSPPEQHIWWSGAFHNGFYRLAIWGEGQDFAFPNAPSDQWWLHLDGGLPKDWQDAEWFGPQQIVNGATNAVAASAATRVMLAENRAGHKSKLYGVEVGVVDNAANRRLVLIEYDVTKGRDLASNPAVLLAYQTSNTEIEGLIVSREMDVAENYIKASDGVQATIRPDNDVTLNLAIIPDSGEDKQEITKSLNPGGFRTNIGVLNTDRIGEGKPVPFSIYATPGDRPLGTTFQFELGDVAQNANPSITINSTNNTLIVAIRDDGGTGLYYQWAATIASGTYTLSQLVAALATAITSAKLFGDVDWTATVLAGNYVRFQTGNSTTNVTISIVFTASVPDVGITPTADQLASSVTLGQFMGFDTSTNQSSSPPDISVTVTSTQPDFAKTVAHYELWGLKANIEVFPRDP